MRRRESKNAWGPRGDEVAGRSIRSDAHAMAGVRRRSCLLTALVLALSQLACGQTGPSTSFGVVCVPSSLLVGQTGFCYALVTGTETGLPATWTSSDPSVASFGPQGALKGRSAGQVVAMATYEGKSESGSVSVSAEDVVRVLGASYQGIFQAGSTVNMIIGGFYGVASADSGQLNLVVTDQNNVQVSASAVQTVTRGGDSFAILHSVTIPIGTTRICRTAVLQIGSVTLTATGPPEILPCINVAQ